MRGRHIEFVKAVLTAGFALLAISGAHAQDSWPGKPVRMVFPFGAGSGPDVLARVIADQLTQSFQRPFLVENKPGANGSIAADIVARAPADGYTFLFSAASGTVIMQSVNTKLQFDVVRDFDAVVQIAAGGVYLVAHPDFPAKDLDDVIRLAKSNPGSLDYATWGVGSSGHLIMSAMQTRLGIALNHIPYKDITQILLDVQAGRIKLAIVDPISPVGLIKAGKIRGIAVSGTQRGIALPEIATMSEQGFKFDTDGWFAVFAPKGTSREIVNSLNRGINNAMAAKEVRARLLHLNLAQLPIKTPSEFSKTVRDDLTTWKSIATASNINVD
jgi:tripartite-type tricarboxylate transporter receptor subunit TctC